MQTEEHETITISGKYSTAEIKTTNVDETCINQVQEIVDHEAFTNPIKVMPDAHAGAGAVVGFTMPLGYYICPNTVGVDIGCGMTAYNLGYNENLAHDLEQNPEDVDNRIRDRIPLGRETFGDIEASQDYHILDDFPWGIVTEKRETLNENLKENGFDLLVEPLFNSKTYLDGLCEAVEYDQQRLINSLGSLGGGNHFIEISQSEKTGDYWVVVHSGSRGIGLAIAEYWQQRAHELQDDRPTEVRERLRSLPEWSYKPSLDDVSNEELLEWVQGAHGDYKDVTAIREHRDGEAIGELVNELTSISRYAHENADGEPLDYLEAQWRGSYLKDMIFAQTYAEESRHQMCEAVRAALSVPTTDVKERINSTHNYIDFEDLVIRKGATRVHSGEQAIIPFNMRDGAIIVEGNGNDNWHQSAPHGAGRRGSRRWAYDEFDVEDFKHEMSDVYSSSVNEATLDEAPMAYKDTDSIRGPLSETASVVDELTPVLNIKAEE
jgi:tRNA-splicing ligase RtcB